MRKMKLTQLLLFATFGIILVSCGSKKEEATKEKVVEKVVVQQIEEKEAERTLNYPCTLSPFEENYLAPASPGRIEKIYVEVGSTVSKGQLIAQMDRTQLIQAETQLKTLELDYKRIDTLAKLGSIAQQQYDQIKGQYDIAKISYDFLKENTQIVAPFSGIIANKYFENGELYSGAPNTAAGKAALVYLIQIDNLKAFVNIPEQYFPSIKKDMELEITSNIYSGETFKGSIFRIHPTIDPASHTFQVELRIPNKENKLRPGMYTHISIEMTQENALVVPASAVLKLQGSNERYIFVAENGKAKKISVQLGKRFDENVEIISNEVKPGDQIIVRGQSRLFDQMEIEIVSNSNDL